MTLSMVFTWIGLFRHRPDVLIFGASGGGDSQFEKIKRTHNVLGFVDNNSSKQGSFLQKRPIYSPQQIPDISFDKIIIASSYFQEINQQLINDIKVKPEKITVFHDDGRSGRFEWSNIRHLIADRYFRILLGSNIPAIAKLGFSINQWLYPSYRSYELTKIHWLDNDREHVEAILQKAKLGKLYGPRFIGKIQEIKSVHLPAIHLSHYKKATFVCTSNTLRLDDKLLMWRSPTSDNQYSDYSSEHVVTHGNEYAITRPLKPCELDKGIAITGSLDVNYYHWMLEVISKLAYIELLDDCYANYPILISHQAQEIEAISSFLSQLNLERDIVYLQSAQYYQVTDLVTITPPNFVITNFKGKTRYKIDDSYCTGFSLQFLRETALRYLESKLPDMDPIDRVFLARKGFLRAYNQDEVCNLLEPRGFKAVYLEDYSFAEQLYIMQGAKIIVGPTGAAWANLLFCQPNTKALCWMANEYGNLSCFSQIAEEMCADMDYLQYDTTASNARELLYSSYKISTQKIENWLDENNVF